jgi:hypothetical protein
VQMQIAPQAHGGILAGTTLVNYLMTRPSASTGLGALKLVRGMEEVEAL